LGDFIVRPRLDGVNEIREVDGILDEENGNVVANDICMGQQVRVLWARIAYIPKLPSSV
jgi:hypothetical protein